MYVVLPIHTELCVYILAFMAVQSQICVSLICRKQIKRNELSAHIQIRSFMQQLPCVKNKRKLITP